jgi:hypothetical protein
VPAKKTLEIFFFALPPHVSRAPFARPIFLAYLLLTDFLTFFNHKQNGYQGNPTDDAATA